jgi:hypothetical protein
MLNPLCRWPAIVSMGLTLAVVLDSYGAPLEDSAPSGASSAPDAAPLDNARELALCTLAAAAGMTLTLDGERLTVTAEDGLDTRASRLMVGHTADVGRPFIDRAFEGRVVQIDLNDADLIPGQSYFAKLDPHGGAVAEFRLLPADWSSLLPEPAYLEAAWRKQGRSSLRGYSGVTWQPKAKRWVLDPEWTHADGNEGPQAYNLEYPLRSGVSIASASRDTELITELAGFLLEYSKRFTTLGELRKHAGSERSAKPLRGYGPDSTRTLMSLRQFNGDTDVEECALCNSQFFHPVARLIRLISSLPASERNPEMQRFVDLYVPIVVKEHLVRLVFEVRWMDGGSGAPPQLMERWKQAANGSRIVKDRDLWLVATAAEMLGAHADQPDLVPIAPREQALLKEIVKVGAAMFQAKRTVHADTRNFAGAVVGSASYFGGDFDRHRDMAYAAYRGPEFPSGKRQPPKGGSWDISHAYRIPVFLRSMYDNRRATGLSFPTKADLTLAINQYVYKVFNGNFRRPLFSNFFDGNDGWYRVGYHGEDFGYPPSELCDFGNDKRPCLTPGAIRGWGLLGFVNSDLRRLERSLIALAGAQTPPDAEFRARYYKPLAFHGPRGELAYSIMLLSLLADNATHFAGRTPCDAQP